MRVARWAVQVAAAAVILSIVAYYALPCAGPGVTHFRGDDGVYRRAAWVRVAAPFHTTGAWIVRSSHGSLPMKRCKP